MTLTKSDICERLKTMHSRVRTTDYTDIAAGAFNKAQLLADLEKLVVDLELEIHGESQADSVGE